MTPATSPRISVKEKTVFVIDDDEIIVEIVSHMLEASGLSKIHCLSTATDALELLKHLKPDIIITDVHMPELSGTFFAKLVADYPQLQDVPVLAVTADDCATAKDVETLEGKVHRIKGSAGTVGLNGIMDLAIEVESEIARGDWLRIDALIQQIRLGLIEAIEEGT